MMPLVMAAAGEIHTIKTVGGEGKKRRFLEGLGFVPGAEVVVLSKSSGSGSLIVGIKGSRIALDRQAALKILI
ncbi:MAG: ferrous iron transport protein A [Synergistes sp.]|nr:ferrous iron transport protein A [Synergistes sp.]